MNQVLSSFAGVAIPVALALLFLAIGLTVVRLLIGPTLLDRINALNQIAVIAIAVIAVHEIRVGSTGVFDAAIVLALVSFLGTLAYARFAESRKEEEPPGSESAEFGDHA